LSEERKKAVSQRPVLLGTRQTALLPLTRQAHLAGPIAAALMANATELLANAPQIEQVDLLAVKLAK
jgi:hypothetical protein